MDAVFAAFIHDRDAQKRFTTIWPLPMPNGSARIHCFSGDYLLPGFLDLNFYISIPTVTFPTEWCATWPPGSPWTV
jgi:Tat protein secretion system quality control protein TatD with DNase activity